MADEQSTEQQPQQPNQEPPTTNVAVIQPPPATGDELGDGGKKALEAERDARKAADKRAKDFERELEKFRQASMSENEKAVAEAKASGRSEALTQVGKRLARAEFKAIAAGKGLDVSALLDDIDVSRYVGDDGEPDEKEITAAVERFAALKGDPQQPPAVSFDGGPRSSPSDADEYERFYPSTNRK